MLNLANIANEGPHVLLDQDIGKWRRILLTEPLQSTATEALANVANKVPPYRFDQEIGKRPRISFTLFKDIDQPAAALS